jgi:hypothetical protein
LFVLVIPLVLVLESPAEHDEEEDDDEEEEEEESSRLDKNSTVSATEEQFGHLSLLFSVLFPG